MSDTPQFKRGEASVSGDQLPKGAASDLNAAVASTAKPGISPGSAMAAPLGPGDEGFQPRPIQRAKPQVGNTHAVGNEDDQLLLGPTARPQEPLTMGTGLYKERPIPEDSHRWMPALLEAAQDPSAPPAFRQMLQILQYHLDKG